MKFEGFFNKEAKDESIEAAINTGRMAEGITEDLGEVQENLGEGEKLFGKMKEGVAAIMKDMKISPKKMEGKEDFFMEKLQERGIITAKQMSLPNSYQAVRQAMLDVRTELKKDNGTAQISNAA